LAQVAMLAQRTMGLFCTILFAQLVAQPALFLAPAGQLGAGPPPAFAGLGPRGAAVPGFGRPAIAERAHQPLRSPEDYLLVSRVRRRCQRGCSGSLAPPARSAPRLPHGSCGAAWKAAVPLA